MFSHVMLMFVNAIAVTAIAGIITVVILRKKYAPFIREMEERNKKKDA